MPTCFIGLGSNLGDRESHIKQAIRLLNQQNVKILKQSTIIETDPVGGPLQDKFLNAVIECDTKLSPHELLKVLQNIEGQLKRERTVKNGPRTIDLDILLYDEIYIKTEELTIPHPRMFTRAFVLEPLNEIAPHILEKYPHAHN